MDILFSVTIGIVIGWVAGRFLFTYQILTQTHHRFKKPLEDMLKIKTQPETSMLYTVVTDKYVYLYDKKTDEFLCQATTLEQAVCKADNLGIIGSVTIVEHSNNSLVLVHQGKIVEEVNNES